MSGRSLGRVLRDAEARGLAITVREMPESTKTAHEAAAACGCAVAQIGKSIVLEDEGSGDLVLLVVSSDRRVNLRKAGAHLGARLRRAEPTRVRKLTGFAIGGVSPLGHQTPIRILMDPALLDQAEIWAAAGKPNAVFRTNPRDLCAAVSARALPPGVCEVFSTRPTRGLFRAAP